MEVLDGLLEPLGGDTQGVVVCTCTCRWII